MRLITIGTGSSGNCYLIQRDNDRFIALDCGVAWKKVMVATKFRPTDIDLALVTHSHSDHAKYMGDFRKNNVPVIDVSSANPKTKNLEKGDIVFIPFELPHDVLCYGYLIKVDGRTIVYMTDFGYCKYTFRSWNVDTWIIACNHTEVVNRDEFKFKHVVFGHSDLDTVKNILAVNKTDSMKNVILCHMSEDADTEQILKEVKEVVGESVNVALARKGEVVEL